MQIVQRARGRGIGGDQAADFGAAFGRQGIGRVLMMRREPVAVAHRRLGLLQLAPRSPGDASCASSSGVNWPSTRIAVICSAISARMRGGAEGGRAFRLWHRAASGSPPSGMPAAASCAAISAFFAATAASALAFCAAASACAAATKAGSSSSVGAGCSRRQRRRSVFVRIQALRLELLPRPPHVRVRRAFLARETAQSRRPASGVGQRRRPARSHSAGTRSSSRSAWIAPSLVSARFTITARKSSAGRSAPDRSAPTTTRAMSAAVLLGEPRLAVMHQRPAARDAERTRPWSASAAPPRTRRRCRALADQEQARRHAGQAALQQLLAPDAGS